LQEYDEDRVAKLRKLKDELKVEFQKGPNSTYFTGTHGKFVDPRDFDLERMIDHCQIEIP